MVDGAKLVKAVGVRGRDDYKPTEGDVELWTLYVDDASNDTRSRAGMMLISPEGHKIHCVIHFRFEVSNNEAEYEALIVDLCLTCKLQA